MWAEPADGERLWRELQERGGVHKVEVNARTKSGETIVVLFWLERIQILGEQCVLGLPATSPIANAQSGRSPKANGAGASS